MSANASARVMVPIALTSSMLKTGTTVPAVDASAGETAWAASAAYALNAEKIDSGSRYLCILAHSGRTALPGADPLYWSRLGPSNRMAPLDDYNNTKAVSTGSLTYVIEPGFLNAAALYGMEGTTYSFVVKDSPGGSVIYSKSGDLYEQAAGFYELMFSPLNQRAQLSFDDIPLAPNAQVTVTIGAGVGVRVAIGTIKLGDWRQFIGDGSFGGVQYGAESSRKSYTHFKENFDGTYQIVRRPSSRNIKCTVALDASQAMYADAILAEILDVAVPFEASNLPNYAYLNTLGFLSGSIRADDFGTTSITIDLKGNV